MSLVCRNGVWRMQVMSNGVRISKTLGRISEEDAHAVLNAVKTESKKKVLFLEVAKDAPPVTESYLFRLHGKTKGRAKDRNIEYLLTKDDVLALYHKNGGVCAVTSIQFDNEYKPENSSVRPWAVSIDRVDSSKPYTLANCRLVCVAVNMGIGQWGLETFERIAAALIFKTHTPRAAPRVFEQPRYKALFAANKTVAI